MILKKSLLLFQLLFLSVVSPAAMDLPDMEGSMQEMGATVKVTGSGPVYGVHLDGTNDYMTATVSGNSDTEEITIVLRARWELEDDVTYFMDLTTGHTIFFQKTTNSRFRLRLENDSETAVFDHLNGSNDLDEGNYYSYITSVKLSATAASHTYIDDVSQAAPSILTEGETIGTSRSAYGIGAATNGGSKFIGDITFIAMYLNYWDLSVEANRRKFFNADNTPALAVDGNGQVDGVDPVFYFSGNFTDWHEDDSVNGNDFTVTGAFSQPAN